MELYRQKSTHIQYICGQLERASTGQLHFQGYVQLKRSQRLSWVRNNISDQAHWERQQGTNQQARTYCTPDKEEEVQTFIENTFREAGRFISGTATRRARNDLHTLRDAIIEGKTQRQIIADDDLVDTYGNHLRFHDRVRSLIKPAAHPEGVHVILLVGAPGTGKTRLAFERFPKLFEIPISNGTLWLDGYDDHETVLFDDFMGRGSKMGLDNTLKFLDRYVRNVPIKGSHVWYRPKTIIVTSNYHPRHWYEWKGREESFEALCRRFHEVIVFESDGSQEPQEDVREYFFDVDQWPSETVQNQPVTGRVGFDD